MAPLVVDIQARGRRMSPPVEVRYLPVGTEMGLRLLKAGKADLALASWLPQGPPQGFVAVALGEDDIAVIVHPQVGVRALDLDTLQRVFEGRYLSWADVGGNEIPLRLVSREAGSGTRAAFESLVMGERSVALTAIVMPSAQAVVEYVSRHEGAIGYVSARWQGEGVSVLRVENVAPGDPDYPLRRTVYAVLPENAPAWTRALLGE